MSSLATGVSCAVNFSISNLIVAESVSTSRPLSVPKALPVAHYSMVDLPSVR